MLIPRENIVVFDEDLKLGINLRRTINVIDFIIVQLFEVCLVFLSLQVERVFHVNYCILCLFNIFASHRF